MKKGIRTAALALTAAIGIAGIGVTAACGDGGEAYITSAIAREGGSGTRGAFDELVVSSGGVSIEAALAEGELASCVSESSSTAAVITAVAKNARTLGYISLGVVSANADRIKAVSVEGVEATTENILSGSYVLSRPFNLVYRSYENLTETAKDFVSYVLSTEGQAIVEENGYIPLTGEKVSYANSGVTGSVSLNGSTSVGPLMVELIAAYQQLNPNVSFNIQQTGSGTGITMAQEGTIDLGMASRDLKSSETGLEALKIADDGIAVIVKKDCALTNVTLDALYNLYINGTKIEAV